MGFIRLHRALKEQRKLTLDTVFVFDYMPLAPENYTKVYLAGLAFSQDSDNELDEISLKLDLDRQTVLDAFSYWQQKGLVALAFDPLSVEYLAVIPIRDQIPKFEKGKYEDFNKQFNALTPNQARVISPNEYNEYYSLMELKGMEIEALLYIITYCLKKDDLNSAKNVPKEKKFPKSYILKTAWDLAENGYRTYDQVVEKLSEFALYGEDIKIILKALKINKRPDQTDKQLFLKWHKEFGFSLDTIVGVAKTVTTGKTSTLDYKLTRYHENLLYTLPQIEAYTNTRNNLYSLTKEIVKMFGTGHDNYDYLIETYISTWLSLGFDEDALRLIAKECAKLPSRYHRTLENMGNHYIIPYHKKGLVSVSAIENFLAELKKETPKKENKKQTGAVVKEGDKNTVTRNFTAEELNTMFERLGED
ncbi:MAG: DnaD domain protein, partial [Firmicutes bacterium]|nr:DnaD domain protein [Bacillota bacterium]